MSRIITTVFAILFTMVSVINAQIKTPAASPWATFSQDVGLITVSGEYSRPGVKGRTIFGDLVPFDKVWRTGANGATKISFSGDVEVEGNALTKGSYAVLTKPGKKSWDVHFYAYEGGSWGSYLEKTPSAIVSVPSKTTTSKTENFTISVNNIDVGSGSLDFAWDKTVVSMGITTEVDAAVMANIEKVLAGPTAGDYYNAGTYYYNSGKDLNKALEYIQKATHSENPRFWQLRMESEVLAKLGKHKEAIEVAKKSMNLAKEAGNEDYVKINTKNISKWSM